jgi:hypothetical protein
MGIEGGAGVLSLDDGTTGVLSLDDGASVGTSLDDGTLAGSSLDDGTTTNTGYVGRYWADLVLVTWGSLAAIPWRNL